MYENVGANIKVFAKISAVIEAIAAFITGIRLISLDEDLIGAGFLVMIIGPILALIISWFVYGFGQLIENSDVIAAEYQRKNEKHEKNAIEKNNRKQKLAFENARTAIRDTSVDEEEYFDILCPSCKQQLSFTKGQMQNEEGVTCPFCDTTILFQ